MFTKMDFGQSQSKNSIEFNILSFEIIPTLKVYIIDIKYVRWYSTI